LKKDVVAFHRPKETGEGVLTRGASGKEGLNRNGNLERVRRLA
jgi:hypothetical protein